MAVTPELKAQYMRERRRLGKALSRINLERLYGGMNYGGIADVMGAIPTTDEGLRAGIEIASGLHGRDAVLDFLESFESGEIGGFFGDEPEVSDVIQTGALDYDDFPENTTNPELHTTYGFNSYMEFMAEMSPENFSNHLVYDTLNGMINIMKEYASVDEIGAAIADLKEEGKEIKDVQGYMDFETYYEFFYQLARMVNVPDDVYQDMNRRLSARLEQFQMDWSAIELRADRSRSKNYRRAFGVKDWD